MTSPPPPEAVFTPAAPVSGPPRFVGRRNSLQQASTVLGEPGRHLLVLGDSGVGRTSFALTCVGERRYRYHQAGLHDAVEVLARRLLGDDRSADPEAPEILVVDDVDLAPAGTVAAGLSPLIRALSDDQRSQTKVILTARRDKPLPSALGNAGARLYALVLERLDRETLTQIVQVGAALAQLDFEPRLVDRIALDADGLPGMAHALCLEASRSAAARHSSNLTLGRDYVTALKAVVASVEPQLARAYQRATSGRGKTGRVVHVLWAAALCDAPSFELPELERLLKTIEGRAVSQQAYAVHLGRLLKSGTLEKLAGGRYRLTDPAMRVYVRLRLRDERPGLVGDDPLQLALPY